MSLGSIAARCAISSPVLCHQLFQIKSHIKSSAISNPISPVTCAVPKTATTLVRQTFGM